MNLDTQPDDPQDFSFTTSGGLSPSSFTLDDDGDNGNGLSNTAPSRTSPGSHYSIAADAVPGLAPGAGDVHDGSQPSNIDVAPGRDTSPARS